MAEYRGVITEDETKNPDHYSTKVFFVPVSIFTIVHGLTTPSTMNVLTPVIFISGFLSRAGHNRRIRAPAGLRNRKHCQKALLRICIAGRL